MEWRSFNYLFMFSLRPLRSALLIAVRRPRLAASYADERFTTLTSDLVDNDDSLPPTAPHNSFMLSNPIPNQKKDQKVAKEPPKIPLYRLHVFSSKNNTIATFTDPDGNTRAWCTAGSVGFKKSQRSGYEAGYQCAVHIFKKMEAVMAKLPPMELHLFFKGYGQGRDALQRALQTSEGDQIRPLIVQLTDRTPIKIGGARAKKARRL